jgi:hypothetical protein
MELQDRIDSWPRPSKVTLHEGSLRCEFGAATSYSLQGSYFSHPHVEFLNATTDDAMVKFVKKWGPLWMTSDERTHARSTSHPLAQYQAERRWLAAVNGLLRAQDEAKSERESLAEYFATVIGRFRCSDDYDPNKDDFTTEGFRLRFTLKGFTPEGRPIYTFDGPLSEWAAEAKMGDVRAAIDYAVELSVHLPSSRIRVLRKGREVTRKIEWNVFLLQVALQGMVGEDVSREDPIYRCHECQRYFKSKTKHWRRFCSIRCARRATDREWKKTDRAEKRVEKEKQELEKGETRAQKTR